MSFGDDDQSDWSDGSEGVEDDLIQDLIRNFGGDEELMRQLGSRGLEQLMMNDFGADNEELMGQMGSRRLAEQLMMNGFNDADIEPPAQSRSSAHCGHKHPDNTYYHGMFHGVKPADHQWPAKISISQVRAQAGPMNTRIWQNYKRLKAIVDRHESAIRRRWEKKSKSKRKEILLATWGSMPAEHRPDVAHLRHRCSGSVCRHGKAADSAKRDHYMWPTINLEDLCKNEPLMLLINARGRHSPATFAFSDLDPALFGIRAATLPIPPFLDGWNMRFVGRDGPEKYGELVSWDDDPTGYQRLHRHKDVSPGEGLWILEIQDRLYRFLLDACVRIIHDLPVDGPELHDLPSEPEPDLLPTSNFKGDAATASLAVTRYENEYHVPARLNLRKLQALLGARLAEAEDTLWALRSDPGFFAHKVHERYQHSPEQLLDPSGQPHRSLRTASSRDQLMARTVKNVLAQYLPAAEAWAALYEQVGRLAEVKERLFDNSPKKIGQDEELPRELAFAFYYTLKVLGAFLDQSISNINRLVFASPPLSNLFRCDSSHNVVPTENWHPTDAEEDYLLILTILREEGSRRNMGVHTCIRELERVAQGTEGRKLITPLIAEILSDTCIMSECIQQIESFQPWAATFPSSMEDKDTKRAIEVEYGKMADAQNPLFGFVLSDSAAKLGADLARMRYPVDNVRNKVNVAEMQDAEASLEYFWTLAIKQLTTAGLYRSRKPKKAASGGKDHIPFGGLSLSEQGTPKSKIDVAETRVKTKSRPAQQDVAKMPATAEAPEPEDLTEHPIFNVDKRAKKVFGMLFYQPTGGGSQQPGEIQWTDFLYAMHHVGFGGESLGGSSWQFTPGPSLASEPEYSRGIQFHEPHPVAKMPFRMARHYGRRLARTYGWCSDMFVLQV